MDMLGAYFRLQASKPQSVAWLGAGNPVGQAAWIIERFHDWSDRREKPFEKVIHPRPAAHQRHDLCHDRKLHHRAPGTTAP